MKKLLITAACIMTMASWNAWAVDEHHPDQVQPAKAPAAETGKPVQKMQENAKKMQGQLDRIAKTKDEKARQKLLQEHMQTMRENMMVSMGMMGDMMDCPMMSGGGMGMMGGRWYGTRCHDEPHANDGKAYGYDADGDGADE